MRKLWKDLMCFLFHEWKYGEWTPLDFADWEREVECKTCNTKWKEIR